MSHILEPVISELFNKSIVEGVFPSCLKTGSVIHSEKKADHVTEPHTQIKFNRFRVSLPAHAGKLTSMCL